MADPAARVRHPRAGHRGGGFDVELVWRTRPGRQWPWVPAFRSLADQKTVKNFNVKRFVGLRAAGWWLLLCGALPIAWTLRGAETGPDGAKIYRQLCVKCHGRKGEGVKGKYDDALHGDWSLEKLTRYIDKNMPDDAPGKCVGREAEAAARYIYDAFY